jgi:hypothetical protein
VLTEQSPSGGESWRAVCNYTRIVNAHGEAYFSKQAICIKVIEK